ncbi:MAG: DNA polymerase III subunit beta [Candidatus Omnitrophota bacterium]
MKISIKKELFLEAILKVLNVINPKTNLPILSNILIESIDSKIKISATDLDIGITTLVPALINESGAITIPAKKFSEIIREFPEEEVKIMVKKNNSINIECKECSFRLMGLPKEEFPQLPDFKNKDVLKIDPVELAKMLELTSFSMSKDETRYVLNGILFEIEGTNLRLVSTDGRRLAIISKDIVYGNASKKISMIIPAKTIQELMRSINQSDEEIAMVISENQVLFEMGQTSVVSRLIEGEFPNYKQVIPTNNPYTIQIERLAFLAALRRASLLATSDYQAVRLELFKNKMVVSKSTPDLGESREEIPMQYNGKETVIGFNPYYLIEALKNLTTGQINIEISDPEKPAVLKEPNYQYVVLPMRL